MIIVDELGRGTSVRDGVALCWAICEHLIVQSAAYTFFVTHFLDLVELEILYPSVKNYQLLVNEQDSKIFFHYQVGEGHCYEQPYIISLFFFLIFLTP